MELPQEERAARLQKAVINSSVEEISKIYDELGEVEMSAPALGLACRFRGLDVVKILIQKGATFDFPSKRRIEETYNCYFGRKCGNRRTNYALYLTKVFEEDLKGAFCFKGMTLSHSAERERGEPLEFLADDKRIEVLGCLLENREQISFHPEEMLYYAIYFGDTVIVEELKRYGIRISDVRVRTITDVDALMDAYWLEYITMTELLDDEDYFRVMQQLAAELDGKLFRFTENLYEVTKKRFYDVRVFEFFLAHFQPEKMKKYQIIRGLIEIDAAESLPVIEREKWLETPKKRDEMIAYASENGRTQSLAWLLDYKNRTADFAVEQEKAEKKMMRELNIAPDSVAALKKIWSYRKREDGTLLITNYKGTDTEVTVPEKIGKGIVTGIGVGAFGGGYFNPKVTEEQVEQHMRITKIILPETLRFIGQNAFEHMSALEEIDIPEGVERIDDFTFCRCSSLKSITIPETVKKIGELAFEDCISLEKVYISEGVLEIGEYAFRKCSVLKSITIPGTVKKIGESAFEDCISLEKVYISEGVLELGEFAFSNCNLKEIRMPESVQNLSGTIEDIKTHRVFGYRHPPKMTVYCPKGSNAEAYCREMRISFRNSEDDRFGGDCDSQKSS